MPRILAALAALAILGALLWRRARPAAHEDDSAHNQLDDQQRPSDGAGPLVHRRYYVDFERAKLDPETLFGRVKQHVESFSPEELARFRKTKGRAAVMAIDDEYHIEIFGPWNGSVRVADVTPTSFTFVTLEGHPEAGEIRFGVKPHPARKKAFRFEIESLARNRDQIVRLGYREARIGQEAQRRTWCTFCERVASASGGRRLGDVQVETEELTRE
ncbi:MAG TPA: DUF1990 family protein [Roseiflexaceae bacterium]|nr:DUF1990 family protein [Roseiflexaceae bacterium]